MHGPPRFSEHPLSVDAELKWAEWDALRQSDPVEYQKTIAAEKLRQETIKNNIQEQVLASCKPKSVVLKKDGDHQAQVLVAVAIAVEDPVLAVAVTMVVALIFEADF